MHRSYDIPNDQMRYVLSTFVVVPKRWMDAYGKRPFTANEVSAVVHYYRTLGRHMGITEIPETFDEFSDLMDSYEAEHFAFDEGARRVADVTLGLVTTFYPRPARRAVEVFSRSLMDEPLLRAFRYDAPHPAVVRACRAALRARGRLLRFFPPRRRAQARRGLLVGAQLPRRLRPRPAGHLPHRLSGASRAGAVRADRHRLE